VTVNGGGAIDGGGCGGGGNTTLFSTSTNLSFGNSSQRQGRAGFTIRATPSFHGSPWFDWLQYKGPDGDVRICQAALVVTTRARGWERLVVRRAEEASARLGYVLS